MVRSESDFLPSFPDTMAHTCVLILTLLTLTSTLTRAIDDDDCVTAATFNAALLHQVEEYEERAKIIQDGIKAYDDPDFYCMQEVWLESDLENLVENVEEKYPHHYSQIHYKPDFFYKPWSSMSWTERLSSLVPSVESPCSLTDLAYFGGVVMASCGKSNGCLDAFKNSSVAGAHCLATNCADKLLSSYSNLECTQCILLMFSSLSAVGEACAPDLFEPRNRLNAPGLVLLSKYPIENAHYTSFFPDKSLAIERGFITAEIKGKPIVCTHLSSWFSAYLEYDEMPVDNYVDQQALEISQLLTDLAGKDAIVLGDLNTGPTVISSVPEKNLTGEFPENFQLFVEADFATPYLDQDGRCTYCEDNPLVNYTNQVIDNILLTGKLQGTEGKRILDRTVHPFSDHFGVQLKVCSVN